MVGMVDGSQPGVLSKGSSDVFNTLHQGNPMTRAPLFSLLHATAITAMIAGCDLIDAPAPLDKPDQADASGEPTPTSRSVVANFGGEAGCATTSLAAPNGGSMIATASGATVVSPDDKYHTSSCPDQFVAEVTGVPAICEGFSTGWDQPLPNNPTSCANARLQVHAYGFSNGAWTSTVWSASEAGLWTGNQCILFPTKITGQLTAGLYSKIRFAVQAWEWVNGRADHKLVNVSCL